MFTLHLQLIQDTVPVANFPLSQLLMMKDKRFPWFILVPRIDNITELYQLAVDDRQQFIEESCLLARALKHAYQGDKVNIAAIGNKVPQLHVHHIVRYLNDLAWPAPVWGFGLPEPLSEQEIQIRLQKLIPYLQALASSDFEVIF
ncbi:Diadenosine tetraphosphate (Ap4A) hydrolase [Allopseudospirillum japonicum]|uniref:Diadenosine tetraphosphate (Ap4A) hydrolase n=1 Tax=Allopseudospirillum japonicum TaxID=64971 RepID=A0A1H6SBQ9_9GAMM|nr:HIT domain-containing protein [Allopseudospirillum japonicum]SEI65299.1 Diadenosine tetraphosphate (Ap4A) hydrolase [Allopseudospirillum japonicum]